MILKMAREKAGLSMQELGEKVGVSPAAICRYEQGQRIPKIQIAKRLAKVLGVKWYELLEEKKGLKRDT